MDVGRTMEWLHCNACLRLASDPSPRLELCLTSCGHVLCKTCCQNAGGPVCPVCRAQKPRLAPVGPKMRPELRAMFQDNAEAVKRLFHGVRFQAGHAKHLVTAQRAGAAGLRRRAEEVAAELDEARRRLDRVSRERDELRDQVARMEEEQQRTRPRRPPTCAPAAASFPLGLGSPVRDFARQREEFGVFTSATPDVFRSKLVMTATTRTERSLGGAGDRRQPSLRPPPLPIQPARKENNDGFGGFLF